MIYINKVNYSSGRIQTTIKAAKNINDTLPLKLSQSGLSEKAVEEMREKYGNNSLPRKKRKSFFSHFISNLNDPIIRILLFALLLNILFSFRHPNWPETIGVAAAVLISTVVSTISEYSSCRAADRMNEKNEDICLVYRDNRIKEISVNDIVVGDVVLLNEGMMIPADGVMISGEIKCDQSALTGESKDIKKHSTSSLSDFSLLTDNNTSLSPDNENLVFRGSVITFGTGKFIVLRTGNNTIYGKVASELQEEPPESPLRKKLTVLAKEISFIGYITAAMVAISYLFNVFFIDSGMNVALALSRMRNIPFLLHELLSALTLAVSILVVAVPEGLPMMITVVLSSNMKRMLRHGVLVKKMVGIETAGAMSILFTDKTGTLTEGKMTLKRILGADSDYGTPSALSSNRTLYDALYDASLYIPADGLRNSADEAAKSFFKITSYTDDILGRIPFRSENRFAAAAVGRPDNCITYLRGAPEIILSNSTHYLSDNGEVLSLTDEMLRTIKKKWDSAAKKGGRIIASAYVNGYNPDDLSRGVMSGLVFCALLHFEDKLRFDAEKSVRCAREAGIKTVMMTGDNKTTAVAIAEECGIYRQGDIALTGTEIAGMSDAEITDILPKLSVIARALPSDKLRIVKIAQSAGYITGMTGDGINDAPSLKAADIGFTMGNGTDITKEAGDIIITDNSFSSIVRAVLYGRTIFKSIRKFIVFQLTMNLCATAVSFIGPFIGIESPVTIIQMLWINIIMDTLGALAFAGEPPRAEYMKKRPLPSNVKILTGEMVANIAFTGIYMVMLSLFFLTSSFCRNTFIGTDENYFLTAFFAFFIFCGIAVSFNSRTPKLFFLKEIGKNKPFIIIMTAVGIIQLLLVYFGGEVFRCTPITAQDLMKAAMMSMTMIPMGAVIKMFMKNREDDM